MAVTRPERRYLGAPMKTGLGSWIDEHGNELYKLNEREFRKFVEFMIRVEKWMIDGVVTTSLMKNGHQMREPDIRKLVDSGILIHVGNDGKFDGDRYIIKNYLDHYPAKAAIESKREKARRRSALRSDAGLMRDVKARDGSFCRYCGLQVDWANRRGPLGGTYDHVVPLSQGGEDTIENLVTCCRRCNSSKGGRSPEQAGMTLLPVGCHDPTRYLPVSNQSETGSKPVVVAGVSPLELPSALPLDLKSSLIPESFSVLASDPKDLTGSARARRSKRKANQETPYPEDFSVSETEIKLAAELGLTEHRERAHFRDKALAHGWTAKDWRARYRTWLRKAAEYAARDGRSPGAVAHGQRREEDARRPYHEPFKLESPEPKASPREALEAIAAAGKAIGRSIA